MDRIKLANASFNPIPPSEVDKLDIHKVEPIDERSYVKLVEQCRFFYRFDPIVSTVINKMVEIGVTKIIFDKSSLSDNEFRVFLSLEDVLHDFAEQCALEYLISGLVVPEVKFITVGKDELFQYGIKKYNALTLPKYFWLRDPTTIKIKSTMVMDAPSYYVVLPDELVYFIMNKGKYSDGTDDQELFTQINMFYPDFVEQVKSGNREILLDNDMIVRRRPLSDSPYPTPFLSPALEALKHKRNLRKMDYSIASRVISAIMLIRLGNDEYPVTEDDEDAFEYIKQQMAWRYSNSRNTERVFQLFGNHTLNITWVYPDVQALLDDRKYAEVNQDIFFSMGFPRILTVGETERSQSSNAEFAYISPVRTMENVQEKVLYIIKKIIKKVAELNNFKTPPNVRFAKINLHSFRDFVEGMMNLYDSANVSRTSLSDLFGFNWQEEVMKRAEEKEFMKQLNVEEFSPKPYSRKPELGNESKKSEDNDVKQGNE